jgi:hypothetical protein
MLLSLLHCTSKSRLSSARDTAELNLSGVVDTAKSTLCSVNDTTTKSNWAASLTLLSPVNCNLHKIEQSPSQDTAVSLILLCQKL